MPAETKKRVKMTHAKSPPNIGRKNSWIAAPSGRVWLGGSGCDLGSFGDHLVDLGLDDGGGQRLPQKEVAEPKGAERGVAEVAESRWLRSGCRVRCHGGRLS